MMIDKTRYTKAKATKSLTRVGWLLYYLGVFNLYLDYQVWRPHYRFWHPLFWLIWLLTVVLEGWNNIPSWKEMQKEMRAPKDKEVYWYKDAPDY